MNGGLLDGIRVLDLSIWRPGPYATQLMAEAGADVLKVEPPGGDPMRQYPGLFARLHVNKRSIVLDLKTDAGRHRLGQLAADADVAVEGFRPGVAARLGAAYDDLRAVNPTLVYCSISGMGQTGPLAAVPGHDVNYQAWAGMLTPDGGPPAERSVPLADLAGGLAAAFAVCAALVRRSVSGEGEYIDVAMSDVLATWTGVTAPDGGADAPAADGGGGGGGDTRAPDPTPVPGYGTFETADHRFVSLGVVSEDHFWGALCDELGLDAARHLPFAARLSRADELQSSVAGAVRRRQLDELSASLLGRGVPVAPVLTRSEMAALEHFRVRQAVLVSPSAVLPGIATGYPVRFTHHPVVRRSPAPALDQHAGEGFGPRTGPVAPGG